MKKFLFSILCPLALVFAGPYDIEEFTANDAGVPDSYIAAEFGGELTKANPDDVADIQEGRLFVRQKFEDPFGADETTYQLYQGQTGSDFSSLNAMTAEGVDYSKLVHAKFYQKRGDDAKNDVAKVYFDGKSIFAEGLTTLIAFVDGTPVTLKADVPTPEPVAAASEEECDDDDPDCEEEEDDYSSYTVSSDVNNNDDANQVAASNAADEAVSRFGIADEVRFWTAVGLSALAVTAAVIGVVQHMKSNEAKDAYDAQDELVSNIKSAMSKACGGTDIKDPDAKCKAAMEYYFAHGGESINLAGQSKDFSLTYKELLAHRQTNEDTMNSYSTARNIWFGVSAASLTAAVVLFVW